MAGVARNSARPLLRSASFIKEAPQESPRNVLGADANLALFAATDVLGKVGGEALQPLAGKVVAGLKGTRAWGLIVKAASREEAGGVLRRMGATPQQAEHALQAVEASGENVRWKGKAKASGMPSNEVGGTSGKVRAAASQDPHEIVRANFTLPDGLRAPNVPATYGPTDYYNKLGEYVRNDAITKPRGQIVVSERLRPVNNDPATIRKLIEALRHEAVHRWFSPKTPTNDFLKKIVSEESLDRRAARGQRYYDNNDYIKYIEEAIAQTYAKRSLIEGLKFPFEYGYTTPGKVGLAALKYHGLVGSGMLGGYELGRAGAEYSYGDKGK